MGTTTYTFRSSDYPPISWSSCDWYNNWLGWRVKFTLCGVEMTGRVIEAERHYLCNGEHDILTVEVEGDPKQVKIQMHRQAFRRIGEED